MNRHYRFCIIILFLSLATGCVMPGKQPSAAIPTPQAVATLPAGKLPIRNAPQEMANPTDIPGGPVWVANPPDKTVLRVDPINNSITARVTVEGHPETVVAGEGAVWALDRKNNLIFRIDPQSNQVAQTLRLPPGSAGDIVAGSGAIWVGMTGPIDLTDQKPGQVEEVTPQGMVVQIDPKTNQIANQYAIQPVSRLLIHGTALWILSRSIIDTPVQVIDLDSRQGMAMPFHNAPEWLPAEAFAVDSSNIWLFSSAYAKIFRASLDGRVDAAISLPESQPTGYADLLLHGGSLWAATPWGTVLRIDPSSNHIQASINLNTPLTALIAGNAADHALWALSQPAGILFRIDLTTNQVVAQIKTGSLLEPTVVPSPTPRIVLSKPCPDAATSRLKIGDLAYVTKDPPIPNRIRKDPNTDGEILGYITPGGSMQILDGPTCANGWVWWRVKNADLEGWTAEGDKDTYWLIPLFK